MSVIFRDGFHILPPEEDVMFERERVGISFAIKRHLFEGGIWFQPSSAEDLILLKRMFDASTNMVISPYVTYVKGVRPADPSVEYPRSYLN